VGVATLLGWPLAGAVLLSANYRRLAHGEAAGMAIFLGMLGTAVMMSIAALVPLHAGSVAALALLPAAGMWLLARFLLVASGRQAAGSAAPEGAWPRTVLLGLAVGGLTAGLAYAYWPEPVGTVAFGPEESVQYTGGAGKADADTLGRFLKSDGYFDGRGAKTVRLARRGQTLVVSFVVKEGLWRNPNIVEGFERLRTALSAQAFGGRPVEVRLCGERLEAKKTLRPPS